MYVTIMQKGKPVEFYLTTTEGSTKGGPWHVGSKSNNGMYWYIVNPIDHGAKKIGPVSSGRGTNYFDKAVEEAQKRNASVLWEELRDVPVDDDGLIEIPFKHFEISTDREDIWHWIEETYNVAIADLMGMKL